MLADARWRQGDTPAWGALSASRAISEAAARSDAASVHCAEGWRRWALGDRRGSREDFFAAQQAGGACASAGLAATHLSRNPTATPAEVEAALVALSAYDHERDLHLARAVCTFAAWLFRNGLGELALSPGGGFSDDPDGDGDDNIKEYLAGSDPNDPLSPALLASELTLTGTDATLRLSLPDALVAQDGTLDTGCVHLPLEVQVSPDLVNWAPVDKNGTLTVSAPSGGFQDLVYQVDLSVFHDERCFLRFAIGQPAP